MRDHRYTLIWGKNITIRGRHLHLALCDSFQIFACIIHQTDLIISQFERGYPALCTLHDQVTRYTLQIWRNLRLIAAQKQAASITSYSFEQPHCHSMRKSHASARFCTAVVAIIAHIVHTNHLQQHRHDRPGWLAPCYMFSRSLMFL